MNKIKHLLDKTKINISLETDLPPKKFLGSLIFLLSLDLKFKISLFINESLLKKN